MEKIRIGYVGTGWIADWHFKGMKKCEDLEVVAGCKTPEKFESCKKQCDEWGIRAFQSLEDLLSDDTIDAVCIFSPTDRHIVQAVAAVKAGKHIMVEKPVAIFEKDVRTLIKLRDEEKKVVFPAHNFAYRPVVRGAREVIDSGKLGNISYASFRAAHFIPPEASAGWRKDFSASGGGAMIDSGTHLVYQSLYLMGRPDRFSAFQAKKHYREMDSEDICQIGMQYPDGTIGSIMQSWASADGSAGEIRIQGDEGNLLITDALYVNGEKTETDSDYGNSFYHLACAFADSIRNGTPPLSDLDDALVTLNLIRKSYESAEKETVEKLEV